MKIQQNISPPCTTVVPFRQDRQNIFFWRRNSGESVKSMIPIKSECKLATQAPWDPFIYTDIGEWIQSGTGSDSSAENFRSLLFFFFPLFLSFSISLQFLSFTSLSLSPFPAHACELHVCSGWLTSLNRTHTGRVGQLAEWVSGKRKWVW